MPWGQAFNTNVWSLWVWDSAEQLAYGEGGSALIKPFRFQHFKAGQRSKLCGVGEGKPRGGLNLAIGLNKF